MAFNPIPGSASSTSTSAFSEDVGVNSTSSAAPASPLPPAPDAPSWAPEISPDAVGLPRLDTVLHRTIAGNDVTITQQELERLTLRSNSAWRCQAEETIARLEREVAELWATLRCLIADSPASTEDDSDPMPLAETS